MAQNKKVDVVTVGGGLVAGIMAYHLTKAGLEVVSLEPLTPNSGRTRMINRLSGNRFRHLFMTQIMVEAVRR